MHFLNKFFSQRRTYRELSQLNDKELHDIGICRGDIKRIVKEL